MNRYTIEHNGKRFTVEASSPDEAMGLVTGQTAPAAAPDKGFNPKEAYEKLVAGEASRLDRIKPLMQGMTFGFFDEIVAGLGAPIASAMTGKPMSETYAEGLAMEREALDRNRKARPVESFAGEFLGGATSGAGALGAGLTTARFLRPYAGLGWRMLSGALDGAAFGAAAGFGSGEGGEDRSAKALSGLAVGGGVGGTMPVVGALLGRITQPVRNAISARVNPDRFAERQISATMQEAGRAPQDIEAAMLRAAQEGQGGVYTIADELGDAGARQLGVAYRGPGEAGNIIKNTLQSRQEGQARRLINQVEDGFQSPQTKAQLEAAQKAARRQEANALYGAAREQAGAVNPSQALAEADAILTPGASRLLNPGSGMAPGERVGAVARARAFLTDGKSIISDFDGALAAKQEMDAMIDGASPKIMEALIPIRNALDDALASASKPYAQARDAYRTASKGIEAIKTGSDAASRGRVDDTIPAFQKMAPNEQAGFRTGYADNLISSIEGQAAGADKSRMFTSEALRREVPAFAEPSRAQALVNQLQREQRMAETGRQAMGGSQTAMRMADDAGVSIGPESMANIARGNFLQPLLQTLTSRGLGGNTPQARAAMAEILLARAGNSPGVLKRLANRQISDAERERLVRILLAGSANAATATGMANTGQK
jgi:hypothetical protein